MPGAANWLSQAKQKSDRKGGLPDALAIKALANARASAWAPPGFELWLIQRELRGPNTVFIWIAGALTLALWFILKFAFHKAGFVHILLLVGISLLVIQFVAYRKTRYQRNSSGR